MCLKKVTNNKPKPTGTGWKVFHKDYVLNSTYVLYSTNYHSNHIRRTGEWINAEPKFEHCKTEDEGFHIYTRKQDAIRNCNFHINCFRGTKHFEILYRQAIATGQGDGGYDPTNKVKVTTARQIYIIPTREEIFKQ